MVPGCSPHSWHIAFGTFHVSIFALRTCVHCPPLAAEVKLWLYFGCHSVVGFFPADFPFTSGVKTFAKSMSIVGVAAPRCTSGVFGTRLGTNSDTRLSRHLRTDADCSDNSCRRVKGEVPDMVNVIFRCSEIQKLPANTFHGEYKCRHWPLRH